MAGCALQKYGRRDAPTVRSLTVIPQDASQALPHPARVPGVRAPACPGGGIYDRSFGRPDLDSTSDRQDNDPRQARAG
jgi:hypothetical protein